MHIHGSQLEIDASILQFHPRFICISNLQGLESNNYQGCVTRNQVFLALAASTRTTRFRSFTAAPSFFVTLNLLNLALCHLSRRPPPHASVPFSGS